MRKRLNQNRLNIQQIEELRIKLEKWEKENFRECKCVKIKCAYCGGGIVPKTN